MKPEQENIFKQRLNTWISKQGFYFQVRHCSVGGVQLVLARLMVLGARLLVLALLLVGAGVIYLNKRVSGEKFKTSIEQSISELTQVKNVEISDVSAAKSEIRLNGIAMEGDASKIFTGLKISSLSSPYTILDGWLSPWNVQNLKMTQLQLALNSGADNDQDAASMRQMFDTFCKSKVKSVVVEKADITWGFTTKTRGAITDSQLNLQRTSQESWRAIFKGGTFSQNWLEDLMVKEIVLDFDGKTFKVSKAELSSKSGDVSVLELEILAGNKPDVKGKLLFSHFPIEDSMPLVTKGYAKGKISGELSISGSINNSEGLRYKGNATLKEGDEIALTNEIRIIEALNVVSYQKKYNSIPFEKGGFSFEVQGGALKLENVELIAKDARSIKGGLEMKMLSNDEVNGLQVARSIRSEINKSKVTEREKQDYTTIETRISEANKSLDNKKSIAKTLYDKIDVGGSWESRRWFNESQMMLMRYDGNFTLNLPSDIFEQAPRLATFYPKDAVKNQVSIEVPISGRIYSLTAPQAEEMVKLGNREQ